MTREESDDSSPEIKLAGTMISAIAKASNFDAFIFSAVKLSADALPAVHTICGIEAGVPHFMRKSILETAIRTVQSRLETGADFDHFNAEAQA